jgi:adenylylsulfate kinase-like enzyme
MVIWLIGLSGAGKTTLAREVIRHARGKGITAVLVDGDAVRDLFGNDLDFSIEGRRANAGRISRLCQFLDQQGIHVVCAVLSLFPESQQWNRHNYRAYHEVFIETPMRVLQKRDSKGLYAKALRGDIKNVVGVDIPFPPPLWPDVIIRNDRDLGFLLSHAATLAALLGPGAA